MSRHSFVVQALLGVTAVMLLASCSRGIDDLEAFVEETKKKPARPIEPMPEIRPYVPFTYSAYDFRDPFSVPHYDEATPAAPSGPRPDMTRRREPLEAYPLDSLNMMGVIEKDKRVLALIRSSDGTIHQVGVGNYAGQNFGRITAIQEDRVDLIEIIPDGMGGWIERPASISMSEQGKQP